MISKYPERTPSGVNRARRRLLFGGATLAGTLITADALLKTGTAYAAVLKIGAFRDRRKSVNPANSPSLDASITFDVFQGQPGTAKDTPTPDATVIAAQKDKAIQDDIAARNQNEWWRTNIIALFTSLTGVAALVTIAVNVWQYRKNQKEHYEAQEAQEEERKRAQLDEQNHQQQIDQKEREKRDEARFQTAVSELGKIETRIGAVITLRTFLQKGQGYERFYRQIFDLAVAYLRMPLNTEFGPTEIPFKKAITELFVEAYPLARDEMKKQKGDDYTDQMLDASGVFLKEAFLANADFKSIFMRDAILDNANLSHVQFQNAYLKGAYFRSADLGKVDLSGANLKDTNFSRGDSQVERTKLKEATLNGAELNRAIFNEANLTDAKLRSEEDEKAFKEMLPAIPKFILMDNLRLMETVVKKEFKEAVQVLTIEKDKRDLFLSFADFQGAILLYAILTNANLAGANFNHAQLAHSNIEMAFSLAGANLSDVEDLTEAQREECEKKKTFFQSSQQWPPEIKW